MSYADRVQSSNRPKCWGDEDVFDPVRDEECAGCRFQHSCRQETNRQGSGVTGYRPSYTRRPAVQKRDEEEEALRADHEDDTPVVIQKEETVFSRFCKDVAMGAARGAAYELYRFTKRYRIP